MIYLLQSMSRMPPHEQMYISDVNAIDNSFYYHTSHLCNAKTWDTFGVAVKYADLNSRGGKEGSAYSKHKVIEISDKDWFEIKLKGEGPRVERDHEIEDCGCDVCAEYIAENGTMSEQFANHEQWVKDNPEASKAMDEYIKAGLDAIMNGEVDA